MSLPRLAVGLPLAGLYLGVLGPPRRLAQARGSRWGRSTPVMFHRLLCAMLRVDVRRLGEPSAQGPTLIVSNHVSWLDIPILGSLEPMSFLAKKEIGGPLLGRQVANLQGVVYVDRQRRRSIPRVNADMAARMRSGEPVVLFAEATTSDGVRLLRFRSSHFQAARAAEAVVQPVYLHFKRFGGLALARCDMPRIAWYGDMLFLPHLRAFLADGGLECDVHYGAPIRAVDHADRKALARAAEAAMRGLAEAAKNGRTHA
jgi:1-acyl-sn-glycerol-3-phosphate acyltransferase